METGFCVRSHPVQSGGRPVRPSRAGFIHPFPRPSSHGFAGRARKIGCSPAWVCQAVICCSSGREGERLAAGDTQGACLVAWCRLAEEIALEAAAAGRSGEGEFLLGLDAFRDDGDLLDAGDLGKCGNEDLRHLVVGEAADIGAVDLDAVDGQRLQIVETVMSGAEVVERDVEAEAAQCFQAFSVSAKGASPVAAMLITSRAWMPR